MSVYISVAVEGPSDEAVANKICRYMDIEILAIYGKNGKGWLDKYLANFNQAARHSPWLIVRDMDHDAECPPALKPRLLSAPSAFMNFSIVVRELEAWLMADIDSFSTYFGIEKSRIPENPETIGYPKRKVIELAKKSRKRDIVLDMVPRKGSCALEGPAYVARVSEYASNFWSPDEASKRSESLRYCLKKLKQIKNK